MSEPEHHPSDHTLDLTPGPRQITPPTSTLPSTQDQSPMALLQTAMQQGYGIETLRELMALKKEWEADEARKAFFEALSNFRSDAPRIQKGAHVKYTTDKGTTEYWHADLDDVVSAISPVLARHGLAFRWQLEPLDGGILRVHCVLSHRAGHYESHYLEGSRDTTGSKNNYQALGSAQSYLQRYTLMAALGLASTRDDDGAQAPDGDSPAGEPVADRITEAQRIDLEKRIKAAGVNLPQFLKHWKINKLDDLAAQALPEAKRLVEMRRQANAKREEAQT